MADGIAKMWVNGIPPAQPCALMAPAGGISEDEANRQYRIANELLDA